MKESEINTLLSLLSKIEQNQRDLLSRLNRGSYLNRLLKSIQRTLKWRIFYIRRRYYISKNRWCKNHNQSLDRQGYCKTCTTYQERYGEFKSFYPYAKI